MVFVTIPNKLSEQELTLQRKFAELRKIKKQLAQIKAASSRPPDLETEKKNLKRTTSEAAEAATEQAKKLLKAGAIKVDTTKQVKQFKRAKIGRGSTSKEGLDRQTSLAGYKPYNVSDSTATLSSDESDGKRAGRHSLRDPFVPSSSLRDPPTPRRGPRIFVRGTGITEDFLKETFSTVGGTILHINMEANGRSGFVTFDTAESADEAVAQFNKRTAGGIMLEVEIARRQRGSLQSRVNFDKNNPQLPDQKSPQVADRSMISYEDDNMFE
ncbi:negative elongation factor E-like isoform X2 [Watersipora subatra]|uniref:negative elongation factor E-like isoform X2 n=1 Tax=Watersipora subatra TaxID=2589382 RepID=UPI00355C7274